MTIRKALNNGFIALITPTKHEKPERFDIDFVEKGRENRVIGDKSAKNITMHEVNILIEDAEKWV